MAQFSKLSFLAFSTLTLAVTSCYGAVTVPGSAPGKHGMIDVEVTFDNNKIRKIDIVNEKENALLAKMVYEEIVPAIVKHNSVEIDAISGATVTSNAVKAAVKAAADKAGIKLAGAPAGVERAARVPENLKYDVVVIGGGGAGFSAAITAHDAGAKVVLLEKMPQVGGNTLISGAELAVSGNWVQKKLGIKDSVEQHVKDTLKGGDYKGDEAMVRNMCENALPAAEWLRDTVHVAFEDRILQFGGHSVKRTLIPKGSAGGELIGKFLAAAESRNIPIFTDTKATELIKDEAGRVIGVKATLDGVSYDFVGKNGVVLATGGFAANALMCKTANPFYDERFKTTNTPAAQGDGIVMAQAVGGATRNMQYIQTYPMCDPVTGAIELIDKARFEGAVLINKEGKRFVEELDRRDVISKGILDQPGQYCYSVYTDATEARAHGMYYHPDEVATFTANGTFKKFDTLEDLSRGLGIPLDNLKATMAQVSEAAKTGKDELFNYRGRFEDMSHGPYYTYKGVPSRHHTMGGLNVDIDAHVLDDQNRVIPGLYAAGEITGLTHGTNRLGSNAVLDIVVYGRIAGENAAAGK